MGAQLSTPWHCTPSAVGPIEYKKLEGYLDNLAHVATNKNAVLQQLYAAATLLTTTNSMPVEEIKALTANKKYLGGLARSANTANPGKGKEKGLWTMANTGRYIVSGY